MYFDLLLYHTFVNSNTSVIVKLFNILCLAHSKVFADQLLSINASWKRSSLNQCNILSLQSSIGLSCLELHVLPLFQKHFSIHVRYVHKYILTSVIRSNKTEQNENLVTVQYIVKNVKRDVPKSFFFIKATSIDIFGNEREAGQDF